jgi:hypothetical protein
MNGSGYGILASHELFANSRARLKNQICMCVRMISYHVPARGYFPYEFGAGARKFPDQKKCRAHGMTFKEFEQMRRHSRIRTVVKGESDFLPGRGVSHGRTEQLR